MKIHNILILITLIMVFLVKNSHAGDLETDNLTVNEDASIYGGLTVTQITWSGSAPTNGLVLYYSFNTNTSPTLVDESGNGYDGFSTNGAAWTTNGMSGTGAYSLDGVNDYLKSGGTTYATNFTYSMWVYEDTRKDVADPAYAHVLYCVNVDAGNQFSSDGGHLKYSMEGGAGSWVSTYVTLPLQEWTHFCLVVESGNELRMYLNGKEEYSVSNSGYDGGILPLRLGVWQSQTRGYFDGRMDEVRAYNRALTPSEVLDLYYLQVGVPTASLDIEADASFMNGIKYSAALGDISMGAYTNTP